MIKQEQFNAIWDHFVVKKNPKSIEGDDNVLFNAETGTKCAIGILIPEEEYFPKMESMYSWDLIKRVPELSNLTMGEFHTLQQAHDHAPDKSFHDSIEKSLREIAFSNNLTIP